MSDNLTKVRYDEEGAFIIDGDNYVHHITNEVEDFIEFVGTKGALFTINALIEYHKEFIKGDHE